MGASICVLGLLVTLWARWTLGGNWSSAVTFKKGHELIRTGPYRFVRIPRKALISGLKTIKAVKLLKMPQPDFVGVPVDQLPYQRAEQSRWKGKLVSTRVAHHGR